MAFIPVTVVRWLGDTAIPTLFRTQIQRDGLLSKCRDAISNGDHTIELHLERILEGADRRGWKRRIVDIGGVRPNNNEEVPKECAVHHV